MRSRLSAGLLAALLAGGPAALHAQGTCGGYIKAPAPGGWSEYVLRVPSSADLKVRLAVTGEDSRRDRKFVWFETRVDGPAGLMVSRLLVPGYPYQNAALQDAVMQGLDGQVIQLGPNLLNRARAQELPRLHRSIVEGCAGAQLVGNEQVNVPAGTFRARHYRSAQAGADIWVSSDFPFGLVKMTNSVDASSMELTAKGTDAKTSVTGTPRLVNGPPG
jgi:hypothetical protein